MDYLENIEKQAKWLFSPLRPAGKVLTGFLIFALAGMVYLFFFAQNSWNQKITVVVETPDGVVSGYSVSSAYGGSANFLNKAFGYPVESGASGEAVVVELPGKRYLFALVSGGPFNAGINVIAHNVFNDRLPKETGARYKALSKLRESRPVPRDMYPLLVTFTDINNPKSVKRVDPSELAASFGAGYKLKSITLEITDEKVTRGRVEKVLGWLEALKGGYLHGGFTSKGAPLGLHGGAFKSGD